MTIYTALAFVNIIRQTSIYYSRPFGTSFQHYIRSVKYQKIQSDENRLISALKMTYGQTSEVMSSTFFYRWSSFLITENNDLRTP